jgi:hypothetical protein
MEAGTVPEKAVISHRGGKYEIGRGKRFYGIWVVGAPYEAPVDRWPENHDGWQQAWGRFAAMEEPGTITPVARGRARRRLGLPLRLPLGLRRGSTGGGGDSLIDKAAAGARPGHGTALLVGEGLLVLGVVLGLVGLFPNYEGGQSLLSQRAEVIPHLCYVIGWALSAALIALSVARPSGAARYGALFGLGLSVVTFGMFLGDVGYLGSGTSLGSGLVISLVGWLACTVGAALALRANAGRQGEPSGPARPTRGHAGALALLVLAGIGTAAAFIPSWDQYILRSATEGTSQTIEAGNAFSSSNPGLTIAGNVIVMVAIIGVTALAALWRPPRQGALLLAGAIVPLVAQAVSALIQVSQSATPAMFGLSASQASELGLTISSGLTGIFWVYFVFVISLLVSCAWLFTEPGRPPMQPIPASPWLPTGGDAGARDAGDGTSVSEDADSVTSEEADSDDASDSDAATGDGEQTTYA